MLKYCFLVMALVASPAHAQDEVEDFDHGNGGPRQDAVDHGNGLTSSVNGILELRFDEDPNDLIRDQHWNNITGVMTKAAWDGALNHSQAHSFASFSGGVSLQSALSQIQRFPDFSMIPGLTQVEVDLFFKTQSDLLNTRMIISGEGLVANQFRKIEDGLYEFQVARVSDRDNAIYLHPLYRDHIRNDQEFVMMLWELQLRKNLGDPTNEVPMSWLQLPFLEQNQRFQKFQHLVRSEIPVDEARGTVHDFYDRKGVEVGAESMIATTSDGDQGLESRVIDRLKLSQLGALPCDDARIVLYETPTSTQLKVMEAEPIVKNYPRTAYGSEGLANLGPGELISEEAETSEINDYYLSWAIILSKDGMITFVDPRTSNIVECKVPEFAKLLRDLD